MTDDYTPNRFAAQCRTKQLVKRLVLCHRKKFVCHWLCQCFSADWHQFECRKSEVVALLVRIYLLKLDVTAEVMSPNSKRSSVRVLRYRASQFAGGHARILHPNHH